MNTNFLRNIIAAGAASSNADKNNSYYFYNTNGNLNE